VCLIASTCSMVFILVVAIRLSPAARRDDQQSHK
jgi:hypothetical protein